MNYYQLLDMWLTVWEDLLKEPNELLLKTSFVNLARVATAEIEHTYKTRTNPITIDVLGWRRKALEWMHDSFQNNDPDISLLKLDHNLEMNDLEPLIRTLPFDPAPIYPLVNKIKVGLSLQTIQKAITDEINKLNAADIKIIKLLTEHLLNKRITKYSQRAIKEILPESLLREGMDFFLRKNIDTLIENEKLNNDLWNELSSLYQTEIDYAKINELLTPSAASIYTILKQNWARSAWMFLSGLDKKMSHSLQLLFDKGNDQTFIINHVKNDASFHKEIGLAAAHSYVELFIKCVLRNVYQDLERAKDGRVETLTASLPAFLLTQAKMSNNRTWGDDFSPNLTLTAVESFGVAASNFLFEFLAKEITVSAALATELGKSICLDVASTMETGDLALDSASSTEQLTGFVEAWSARRLLHRGLKLYLQPLTDHLCVELPKVINPFKFDGIMKSREIRQAFWLQWVEMFVLFSRHYYKDLVHYLPWATLDAAEFETIMKQTFSRLSGSSEEYAVTLQIKGLNADDKHFWKFDDVSFFDFADYDFGESRWFGSGGDGITTCARLFVETETKHEAGVKAWLRLHEVLNSFGLNLGISKQWGGFDPEVNPQVFTLQIQSGDWTSEAATTTRQEMATEQSVGVVKKIAHNFENLLKTARNPANLSNLQKRILSAFNWYQKGRWKRDPAESYIFYWIGLESLFGEANRDALFKSMGRLLVTWREVYGYSWTALRRMQDELLEMIEADSGLISILHGYTQFSDWEKDIRVLLNLNNANFLITLIPTERSSIKSYAVNYRNFLKQLKDNESAVQLATEKRTEQFHFKLVLLKSLRNDMTHDGTFYRPEMLLYNEELEHIFEKTLIIIANEVIQPTPFYNDLAILIDDSEQSFIS